MSALRTQGPITTGLCCYKAVYPQRLIARPRRMGPCFRRDDAFLGRYACMEKRWVSQVLHPPHENSTSSRARCGRMEHQRKTVHAVAQAGRLRTIVEDVAEMAAAATAVNFGAQHAEGAVLGLADGVLERLIKTRPAGAALEFGVGREQRQVAAGAGEDALAMFLEQRARTRALGALLAQDLILLRSELRAPFRIGLFDLEFLRGLGRRCPQPAEGGKAKQTCDRGEQDAAVNHDGLRAGRNSVASLSNTGSVRRSYTDRKRNFSLSCEAPYPPSPDGAGAGGCGRSGRGRPGGGRPGGGILVPAWRLASARRASRMRSSARTRSRYRANAPAAAALPRPHRPMACPAIRPVVPPAQTSSNGENSRQRSSPHRMLRAINCPAIALVLRPWRPKPLATHKPRRNWPICGMPCTVCPIAPPQTSAISIFPRLGKILRILLWMADANPCGRAAQVVSGLAHISRSPSTTRKSSTPSLSGTDP